MGLIYSKQIIATYFVLAIAACVLFIVGKIGLIPIMLMLTGFMLYFSIKAIQGFFTNGKIEVFQILIFWGTAVQLSLQIVLLFNHDFRYLVLCVTMALLILLLFLISRQGNMNDLLILNILISMISGTIYFNF